MSVRVIFGKNRVENGSPHVTNQTFGQSRLDTSHFQWDTRRDTVLRKTVSG